MIGQNTDVIEEQSVRKDNGKHCLKRMGEDRRLNRCLHMNVDGGVSRGRLMKAWDEMLRNELKMKSLTREVTWEPKDRKAV